MRNRIWLGLVAALLAVMCACPLPAAAVEMRTVPLLIIVVGFDGGEAGSDAAVPYDAGYDWGQTVFGDENSLAAYYQDMSNGAFTFGPAPESCASGTSASSGDARAVGANDAGARSGASVQTFRSGVNTNEADVVDDGIVHVTLHRAHEPWGLVNQDAAMANRFADVVLDACKAASGYVDFSSFDVDGDGLLSNDELAVGICVAGYDASAFEEPDRRDIPVIWPHSGKLISDDGNPGNDHGDESDKLDGVLLDSYIAFAEYLSYDSGEPVDVVQEPLGILYHELGHYLDLPDLYPLNDKAEKSAWGAWSVGELSLMDLGVWSWVDDYSAPGGYRYQPTAFDAWSRYALGWTTPQVATTSGDYVLTSQLSDEGYSQLLIPTSDPDEYYLLENRQAEGYDVGFTVKYAESTAQGGIVIWHVDKEAYAAHGLQNTVNDTDHAPAVMPQFFEEAGDCFSTDWAKSTAYLYEPFFSTTACEGNLNDAYVSIDLPLYGDAETAKPSTRTNSGVTVQFSSEPAREMTVHVELAGDVAGTSSRAYELNAATTRALRMGAGLAPDEDASEGVVVGGNGESDGGADAQDGAESEAGAWRPVDVPSDGSNADSGASAASSASSASDATAATAAAPASSSATAATAAAPASSIVSFDVSRAAENARDLADIVCTAVRKEAHADVSIVGVSSVKSGIPSGDISWERAYGVLADDANIACYDLRGSELVALVERSMDSLDSYRRVMGTLKAIQDFDAFDAAPAIAALRVDEMPAVQEMAAQADDSMMFGGLSFDANWENESGTRVENAKVNGALIEPDAMYYVAVAPDVAERVELFEALKRDTLLLWGTPADAMRSLVQYDSWEEGVELPSG